MVTVWWHDCWPHYRRLDLRVQLLLAVDFYINVPIGIFAAIVVWTQMRRA